MAGKKGIVGGLSKVGPALRAAAEQLKKIDKEKRSTDITLPPGTTADDLGAGPLREGQVVRVGKGKTDLLSAKERRLRDEFDGLKPSAKRGERSLGKESKFAPYFAAQQRLAGEVAEARKTPFKADDPDLRVSKKKKPAPKSKSVTIDGKKYKVGETKEIEQARKAARIKEKLLARDAEGMSVGGIQTRKQIKAKKAYKEYVKSMKDPKKSRKQKSAKRKRIANRIMPAARGGLMKNTHTDFRTGGLFK